MKNKKRIRIKIKNENLSHYSYHRMGLEISFYLYKYLTILINIKITIAIIASFINEIKIKPLSTLLNKFKFFILIPFWNNEKKINLFKIVPQSYINKFNKGIAMLKYSMPWLNININKSTILLIPAVSYDIYGCRLGKGMGFYDNIIKYLLKSLVKKTPLLGIIINTRIKSIIPIKTHDHSINIICSSKKGIIKLLNPF